VFPGVKETEGHETSISSVPVPAAVPIASCTPPAFGRLVHNEMLTVEVVLVVNVKPAPQDVELTAVNDCAKIYLTKSGHTRSINALIDV
jgi:hypothetical protein